MTSRFLAVQGYFDDIFGCLSCISVTNKIINVDVTVLQHLLIVHCKKRNVVMARCCLTCTNEMYGDALNSLEHCT